MDEGGQDEEERGARDEEAGGSGLAAPLNSSAASTNQAAQHQLAGAPFITVVPQAPTSQPVWSTGMPLKEMLAIARARGRSQQLSQESTPTQWPSAAHPSSPATRPMQPQPGALSATGDMDLTETKVEPTDRGTEEMQMDGSLAEDSSSASTRGWDSSQPSLLPFECSTPSNSDKLQAKADSSQTRAACSTPDASTDVCPPCGALAGGHSYTARQPSSLDDQQRKHQYDSKTTHHMLHATEGQLAQTKIHLDEPARTAEQLPEDRDSLLARLLTERDQRQRQREQVTAEFGADQDQLVQQHNDLTAQLQSARDRCAQLALDVQALMDDKQKLFNAELNSRNEDVLVADGCRQQAEQDLRQLRAQMNQREAEAKQVLAIERNQRAELEQQLSAAHAAQQQLEGEKVALARSLQEQRDQSAQQQREAQAELQRQTVALRSQRDNAMAQLQKLQKESAAAAAAATVTSSNATEQAAAISRQGLERSLQLLSQQLTQQQQRGRALEQQLAQASAEPSQLRSQLDLARQQLQRVSADAIQAKDAHTALASELSGVKAENQRMSQTNQLHQQVLEAETEKQRNEQSNMSAAALQRWFNSCMRRVSSGLTGWEIWSRWCSRAGAEACRTRSCF